MKGGDIIISVSDFEYLTETGSLYELENAICDHCQADYVDSSTTELPMKLYPDLSGEFWVKCNNATIEFNLDVKSEKNDLLCVKVSKISRKRRVKRV